MSECGVCIGTSFDSYDGNEFDCGWHMMDNPTKCCECNRAIPAGESFESAHWLDEDERPCEAHTCALCAEIAWAFSCNARIYYNLWEDMEDSVFPEFSVSCLEKLKTPASKADLQSKWMKWKGLSA